MPADGYTLVIGDKNFSSWSLRPWIAMKYVRLPFAEERIRLRWPGSSGAILRHSSSGEVPAIKTNGLVVFDSLAILEFLAERYPELQFWPRDVEARARSISTEMHSGFLTLRNDMSTDVLARVSTPQIGEELERDIRRIVAIWRETRMGYGAAEPFLFGTFTNADCYVHAGGDALPHLWGGPSSLRRRRSGRGLCRHYPRAPRDGRVNGGGRSGNQGVDDRLSVEVREPRGIKTRCLAHRQSDPEWLRAPVRHQ